MVKEVRVDSSSNPLWHSLHKQRHVFVKLAVSFVVMGIAFRLFFSDNSFGFSTVQVEVVPSDSEPSLSEESDQTIHSSFSVSPQPSPLPLDLPLFEIQTSQNGK